VREGRGRAVYMYAERAEKANRGAKAVSHFIEDGDVDNDNYHA